MVKLVNGFKLTFLERLALKIGGGSVGGVICGFLAKQFIKFLAFLLVAYFGSLAYLAYRDYIKVYWKKLYTELLSMQPLLIGQLEKLASIGIISASFIGGFYIGFTKG